jgi:hypothetical protein
MLTACKAAYTYFSQQLPDEDGLALDRAHGLLAVLEAILKVAKAVHMPSTGQKTRHRGLFMLAWCCIRKACVCACVWGVCKGWGWGVGVGGVAKQRWLCYTC